MHRRVRAAGLPNRVTDGRRDFNEVHCRFASSDRARRPSRRAVAVLTWSCNFCILSAQPSRHFWPNFHHPRGARSCSNGVHVPHAVLIVEDDADLREMMEQLLHLEGFAPLTAPNGREALMLLEAGAPVKAILPI